MIHSNTRSRTLALVIAGLLPLAACEAGETDAGLDEGAGAEPAAEAETGVAETGAAEDGGLATWDTDADDRLAREEWDAWYEEENAFGDWNTDAEEGLSEDEFATGVFTAWDADQNDALTEEEWNEGAGTWFGDAQYGDWGEWDANGDSALDANEVAEGFERNNLYDTVDRDSDAVIDDEEIADWWFDIWDGNDDSAIDTTEWDQVGSEWSRIGATG